MDIEGGEWEVFSHGAADWIDAVRTLAVETHDRIRPGCRDALERAVAGRGFTATRRGEYDVLSRPSQEEPLPDVRAETPMREPIPD